MAKKKISRKELLNQEDEFVTNSMKLLQWVLKYKVQVSLGFGIFLVCLCMGVGVRYYFNQQENNASMMLEKAKINYESLVQKKEHTSVSAITAGSTGSTFPGRCGISIASAKSQSVTATGRC